MKIIHNEQKHRFETEAGGDIALLEYRLHEKDLWLVHTFVPEEYRDRGIAYALIEYALEYAITHKLRVIPYCSSAVKFIMEHPEFAKRVEIEYDE